jgi:hypothetical protein
VGRHLALAGGAVLCALLLAECGARLLLDVPRYHDAPLELDPELGFRGIPGHVHDVEDERGRFAFRLNAQGLRGAEVPAAPARGGEPRIALVGDSFLVGQAVREDQLVAARLATALAERGREARVYNLSVVDYGTLQELLLLRRLGPRIAPDAVVLFLYPANDLANNAIGLAGRTSVSAGDPIRPYAEVDGEALRIRWIQPLRALARRHSRLFAALERRTLAATATPGSAWPLPTVPRPGIAEQLQAGRAPREDFEIFRRHLDPRNAWEVAWRETFALLRIFRAECERLAARLLVVVVPSRHQVERTAKVIALDVASRLHAGARLDRLLDWNLPERRLAQFFSDDGIEAHLLLGALREATASGSRVYGRDEHLSPQGLELAARAVARWLLGEAGAQADEVAGDPVAILPPAARAPALLDFREARHAEHLGDGWLAWRPRPAQGPGGWLVGTPALAVLPARSGDLVVRGHVPAATPLPIAGRVSIAGAEQLEFRLERPGAFEVRMASPAAEGASADGWIAALVELGGAVPSGVVVEQIGFDAARDGDA